MRLEAHSLPRTPLDEDLAVISWILPHTDRTKADSRKERSYPSERWARARKYGEEFNIRLRDHVVEQLDGLGLRGGRSNESSFMGAEGFRALRLCIRLVRAPRRVCCGTRHLRSVRRSHHPCGQSHALRVGCRPYSDSHDRATLYRPSRLLSPFFPRNLRKMHRAVPGGSDHESGTR